MSQRHEPADSADDFPTPPWATRALLPFINTYPLTLLSNSNCLEPAAGRGYMSRTLAEAFREVVATDRYDYGDCDVGRGDFLYHQWRNRSFDWVITNPPFKSAKEFVIKALPIACDGVAMLTRTAFLESVGRYEQLFSVHQPTSVLQFVERVPMVRGRLDRSVSTATSYAWIVWDKRAPPETRLIWIPPCRKLLERDDDYE
jgi:hypothetical protein